MPFLKTNLSINKSFRKDGVWGRKALLQKGFLPQKNKKPIKT